MGKTINIGSDHAGYELKEYLKKCFKEFDFVDFGTNGLDSVDYPDFAHPLAEKVEEENGIGILICGSGNGISMAANKHEKIRCAICWNEELAVLARQHNNANVLALPARFISQEEALSIAQRFLSESFEGGRHERRVNKI